MIQKYLARAAFCAVAALAPLGASATSLQVGQSTDFRVDFRSVDDVILNGWTVTCLDRAVCPAGTGFFVATEMLQANEAFEFGIGSKRGQTDLFSTIYVNGGSAVSGVTLPMPSDLFVAAGVDELFLRITARTGDIDVSEASVRNFGNRIDVSSMRIFEAVPISSPAVIPLPASGMMLLTAGIGLLGFRWYKKRNRT